PDGTFGPPARGEPASAAGEPAFRAPRQPREHPVMDRFMSHDGTVLAVTTTICGFPVVVIRPGAARRGWLPGALPPCGSCGSRRAGYASRLRNRISPAIIAIAA